MPTLEFSVSFKLSEDHLGVSYNVSNQHHQDAYLFNRLYRYDPEIQISNDIVYAHLKQEERLVWLNKKIPDLPAGKTVTAPVVPFVHPIRSGEEFNEEFQVTVPVREYREYSRVLSDQQEPREETYVGVYFSLGYYWRPEGTTEEEREIDDSTVILPRAPIPYRPPSTGLLESPITKLDIRVFAPSS